MSSSSSPSILVSILIGVVAVVAVALYVRHRDESAPRPPPPPVVDAGSPRPRPPPPPPLPPPPLPPPSSSAGAGEDVDAGVVVYESDGKRIAFVDVRMPLPLCSRHAPAALFAAPSSAAAEAGRLSPCPDELELGFGAVTVWTVKPADVDGFVEVSERADRGEHARAGFLALKDVETPDMLIVGDVAIPLPLLMSGIVSSAKTSVTLAGRPTPDPCEIEHCADYDEEAEGGPVYRAGPPDDPLPRVEVRLPDGVGPHGAHVESTVTGIQCCT